jgi:zeaxanthin glucosyltransferase
MEKTILFLMLPYPSHQMACFSYARTYLDQGSKVVFTGYESQRTLIEREGFSFEKFSYMEEYKVGSFKIFTGIFLKTCFDKSFAKVRYKEFYKIFLNCRGLVEKYKFSKVYIDAYVPEYRFFFEETKVNLISTNLSSDRSPGIPPENSGFIPDQSFISNVYCSLLWLKKNSQEYITRRIKQMALWNATEDFFLMRIRANRKDQCKSDSTGKIILVPQEFEYPFRKLRSNEMYFYRISTRVEDIEGDEYQRLVTKVSELKKRGYKVIYCSLGTLSAIRYQDVLRFYENLSRAVKNMEKVFLVISAGSVSFKPADENIVVYKHLPQLAFLKHVDLMINHGGIGSIKECIDNRLPFICVPVNHEVDQPGNAARAVYHGMGKRLSLKMDKSQEIENVLNFVLYK